MNRAIQRKYACLVGILSLVACRENKTSTAFFAVPDHVTNIVFDNSLTQTEYFNIIEYLYFYNGGGVSTGDINNDGLVDIYFTANQLQNKLYLNKGNFVFEDITETAGVAGVGNWKTGTTMADVNGDGLLDIFVCGVGNYKFFNGKNQLLINNGDLTFSDQTDAYGLGFEGFSTHAAFFDYDNDGDLDIYLLNHSIHSVRSYGHASLRNQTDSLAGDRLYRNERIPHGKDRFTDVTSHAGIYSSQVGYGLGVGISDLNMDGYMDIYISNDFHENDYLYINQRNGTFHETLARSVPHSSRFSMGNDIADINNDGLPDIITLDMLPKDEGVIKTTAGEDPFDIYEFKLRYGYHHQFARNALQLNRGLDEAGDLLFSDIAPLGGVEASDWSWAPLLADFDNDGNKDLFIANGILTRPNDLDYINFISTDSVQRFYKYEAFIQNMPSGSVPNLFFKNEGNLNFKDVSKEWIGENPGFSTGAAYADLDNDGDLDLVINNVNQKASVFRNDLPHDSSGWLQIELAGEKPNTFGVGAKVMVYAGGHCFYHEQILSRGWQSSVSPLMHIGIGKTPSIDSVVVVWPDRKYQVLTNVRKNQRIKISQGDAGGLWDYKKNNIATSVLTRHDNIPFAHRENGFNAFNSEKMIPHMVSTQGPSISVGDFNGDGLDDFFVGGGAGQPGEVFIQDRLGHFSSNLQPALEQDSVFEDTGSAVFDADGNGTLDLIVVSGGQESSGTHPDLVPRLYLNSGTGILRKSAEALPEIFVNASCVKAADIDGDNDLDLFIGGRVVAGQYGRSPKSYLLINDGKGKFSGANEKFPQAGGELGMVADAVWCDMNTDGRPDLVVVGEWMPITILMQDAAGNFADRTTSYGLNETRGWWNTVTFGDFDQDGDIDLVAGNLGLNSRLRATPDEPVTLYAGDIDHNGGMDHLLTYFNDGTQYPFISRDQLVKQVPSFRREFLKYSAFKNVKREHIIPAEDTARFIVNRAYCFASVYVQNDQDKLTLKHLPVDAQMFPIFSFEKGDFNADGHIDLLAVGNLYSVQPDFGRYDAGYGLMMLGDGNGTFSPLSLQTSGFIVKGEGREIKALTAASGRKVFVVGRNNDSLLLFR